MFIEEVYNSRVKTISPDKTLKEAIQQLVDEKTNGLIVTEANKVVGVLALQDIAGATLPNEFRENVNLASAMFKEGMFKEACMSLAGNKVRDLMRTDFMSVNLKTNIMAVMADFLKNDLYIVPVIDNRKLIGVVTRIDIKKAIALKMEAI